LPRAFQNACSPVTSFGDDSDRLPGLIQRWNWKSAVLSSVVRSGLFFAANLGAGAEAARAAFLTELIFRATTAGFYGALTQAFKEVRPPWLGTAVAIVALPAVSHGLEFFVHWTRGTARLAASLVVSIGFTALSTSFNLFAMRRGALIVGPGSRSLWHDLRRAVPLVALFIAAPFRGAWRFAGSLGRD
jgi:hypothetical protein